MAGYSARQSTIADGNVGYDSLWNDEYNTILAAFAALTGHAHDGSAGEGGYIPILADVDAKNKIYVDTATNQIDFYIEVAGSDVLQFSLLDGQILPATDNDVDLGSATKAFKDLYVAGTSTIVDMALSGTLTGGTITGTTLVVASNTITTAASGNLTSTELNAALAELQTDIDTRALDSDLTTHISDTTTHGTTGDIVGTSDTQVLTNKTVVVANNTVTTAASGNLVATELNAALAELDGQDTTIQSNLDTHIADTTTHGTTGDIVGTSDTQALTNKTIDLTDNTISGTTAEFNTALSDGDFATLDGTEILTNKAITSPDINGGTADSLTSLTVAADSNGNVSRYVMTTTAATAAYYAKLATIAFPATNNVAANLTLLLTPKNAAGSYAPVLVTVTALQGTSGLSSSSKIEVLSTDGAAISYDDFFLDTATATNGTDVDLWMQSIIAAAYYVQVLAESFDSGVSVSSYNDGATWQASAPSGAVTVSSSYSNARPITQVYNATAQSIPNNVGTTKTFSATTSNPLGAWSNNDRFTVPAGVSRLRVTVNNAWASNSSGRRLLYLTVNGTGALYAFYVRNLADGVSEQNASCTLNVSESDVIRIVILQDSGASLDTAALSGREWATFEVIE